MDRKDKRELVDSLNRRFKRATVAVLTEFVGLSVGEMNRLRRELREVQGEYKIAKNTLMRLAVRETGFEVLEQLLDGQIGLVFGEGEAADVARVLVRFAQEYDDLKITGGVLEGQVLDQQAIDQLASLPSREVLLGQVLGTIQAPATQLVRVIQEPAARIARICAEVEKKQKEG